MAVNMGFGGTIRKTSDGELFAAGDTCRVFSLHIVSSTDTGGVVLLKSGGSSGDVEHKSIGTANSGFTDNIENGMQFTNGCFVDVDANVVSVDIQCIKEL